jgi:hypothetical protein
MSDQPEQAKTSAPDAPVPPSQGEPDAHPVPRYPALALGLAGALVLVVAVVATAPFWAALLPWGAAVTGEDAILTLERRVGALEAKPTPPALPPVADLGEVRRQIVQQAAATADLAARLDRLERAALSQPASDAATRVEALDRAVRAQQAASAELAAKVTALDKAGQARAAHDTAEIGVLLALLQVRNAVAAGRPFAAEYEALAALARGAGPDIANAAAPLADPAQTGVAGRPVLARRLRELAGPIIAAGVAAGSVPAAAPDGAAAEPGWTEAVLARLRGLVTIRRIDAAGQGGAAPAGGTAAAVNAAELALAGGDLAAAVAALDKLTGRPAEAAAPWLRMARERLAVETALQRIEALLTARLGAPGSPATTVGSPG